MCVSVTKLCQKTLKLGRFILALLRASFQLQSWHQSWRPWDKATWQFHSGSVSDSDPEGQSTINCKDKEKSFILALRLCLQLSFGLQQIVQDSPLSITLFFSRLPSILGTSFSDSPTMHSLAWSTQAIALDGALWYRGGIDEP